MNITLDMYELKHQYQGKTKTVFFPSLFAMVLKFSLMWSVFIVKGLHITLVDDGVLFVE